MPSARVERPGLVVSVLDENEAPVPDAAVVITGSSRDGLSGSDGVAMLPRLGKGKWSFSVVAQGYSKAEAAVTIGAEDATAEVVLTVADPDAGRLRGEVFDTRGAPVQGARILVEGNEVAQTDGDGRYAAADVGAGDLEVRIEPPGGAGLGAWTSPTVHLAAGAGAFLSTWLPGQAPPTANHVGSTTCAACHATHATDHAQGVHARTARTPAVAGADLPSLAAAFTGGQVLPVGTQGLTVTLSENAGTWLAQLDDGFGGSTGPLTVVEVYGGHRVGASLAVDAGGTRAVLPITWAFAGQGLSTGQDPEGWVSHAPDGWVDGSGALALTSGQPGPEASWDLQCGGCHATGHALAQVGAAFELQPPGTGAVERAVGCEACHGPGSRHVQAAAPRYITNPARLPAWQQIEVCAHCHERVTDDTHPFSQTLTWPVDDQGTGLFAGAVVSDAATPDPDHWLEAPGSMAPGDQVGELRRSPHHGGPDGFDGACNDCHLPHGGGLRALDNTLCTTCHATQFPDVAAEFDHVGHPQFAPGPWSPGACWDCHMPRSAVRLRHDAVSGAGDSRSHALWPWRPEEALAEFDAAGVTTLPPSQVPVGACIDCHAQVVADRAEVGSSCFCPQGDPGQRQTYVAFQVAYDIYFGGTP